MFDIAEELKKLPSKPGVYIMKNADDEIIYVGKAISLKNRVRQYFQSNKNHSAKVISMVKHIAEFEYIVTDSEREALLLECNLIKEHSPKYNIMLKDDKMYPYIKVTVNETFPRVFMVRRIEKDGAEYIGPVTDGYAVKETIEMVNKMWPLRKCRKVLPRDCGKERPCLNYHIGQCCAPCQGNVTKEEYAVYVNEALDFLKGKHNDILKKMEQKMNEASEKLEFETAAKYRDKIKYIKSIEQRQKISNTGLNDSDVIAFVRAFDEALIQVFFVRNGKVMGREHFLINNTEGMSRSEIITEFVKQFYSGTAFIPKELILSEDIVEDEKETVSDFLSYLKGMIMPLIHFPSSILSAVSTTMVPAISKQRTAKKQLSAQVTVNRSICFTAVSSCFSAVFLFCFAEEICNVIYSMPQLGEMLKMMSVICPLMYIQITTNSILNSVGKHFQLFIIGILSSLSSIGAIYFIMPLLGIRAFLYGSLISSSVAVIPAVFISDKFFNIKYLIIKYHIICFICAVFSYTVITKLFNIPSLAQMFAMPLLYAVLLFPTGIVKTIKPSH